MTAFNAVPLLLIYAVCRTGNGLFCSSARPLDLAGKLIEEERTSPSIELDIGLQKGSHRYKYSASRGKGTWTANRGFYFTVVKESEEEIWRSPSPSRASSEVTLSSTGSNEEIITIKMPRGPDKYFKRLPKGEGWVATSSPGKGRLRGSGSSKKNDLGRSSKCSKNCIIITFCVVLTSLLVVSGVAFLIYRRTRRSYDFDDPE